MPSPTKNGVFISYSHDSGEHSQRVRALAEQLRKDGVDASIDQYTQDPNEGWIRWMRSQVKQSDRVLLIFTETYQRRFEGDEEDGKGLGATFEGVIVTQALYEIGGRNAKFRPVVFREEDEKFIPVDLQRFNRYRVDTPEGYEKLLRWLHEAPSIVAPPVRQKPDLPPESTPELFPDRSAPSQTQVKGADKDSTSRDPPVAEDQVTPREVVWRRRPPKKLWWLLGTLAAVAIWFVMEESLYRFGDLFKKGTPFLTQNLGTAHTFYWIAAEMGNAWGMKNLGDLDKQSYERGDGREYAKSARDWYEKAANNGISWGMYSLAELYEQGVGGDRSKEKAIFWYKKAADDAGNESPKQKAEEALQRLHAL